MKKGLLFFAAMLLTAPIFAGGILTNANQSAAYLRMIARDATTQIDAVYYNPAGLVKLQDGFHFSLNNQTLFSKRTVDNGYPGLNEAKYVGDVTVPFFPGIYSAYKKGNWVLSFGFQPNSGGGTANYGKGLPVFETGLAGIKNGLNAKGINTPNYTVDLSLDGKSVFWGTQIGASYKINDMLSAFAGIRLITAINTYNGEMKNIRINPQHQLNSMGSGNFVLASDFFTALTEAAQRAVAGTQLMIKNGIGGLTLQQALDAKYIDENTAKDLATGLGTAYNPAWKISEVQSAYQANAASSSYIAANTVDQKVDVKQTGTGYTPIIGVNITPNDKINIGVKYEFKTRLELTNKTKSDLVTPQFPDGAKYRSDIPAILSIGIDYKVLPDLKLAAGLHHYFDKDADWNGKEKFVTDNLYELSFGMEYNINEKILVSAGYLYAQTGVGQGYQTDISHSLSSSSVGFGGAFKASEMLTVNLGILYTQYVQSQKSITYAGVGEVTETYNRNNLGFGIGFDFHF